MRRSPGEGLDAYHCRMLDAYHCRMGAMCLRPHFVDTAKAKLSKNIFGLHVTVMIN